MSIDIESLSQMLILDEANRQFPYLDTEDKLTIGIGHNLTDKGLSKTIRMMIFMEDIKEVETDLFKHSWFTDLDDVRRLVIADMAFNLGMPKLLQFKRMIAGLKAKDYTKAADEMMDSKWADQVGIRAERLSHMMRHCEIHEDYMSDPT